MIEWHGRIADKPDYFSLTILALVALTTVTGALVIGLHPSPLPLSTFMMDQGYPLVVTREMQTGHTLYRDVAWPYGPIPILVYAAVAWLFGNSAFCLAVYQGGLAAAALALGWIVYRSRTSWPVALATSLLVFIFSRAFLDQLIYHSYELIFVLLLMLIWRTPVERTWKRNLVIALILAGLHLSKFGTQIVAGMAVAAIDLLAVFKTGASLAGLRLWGRTWLEIVVAYFLFMLMAAGLLLVFLSPALTLDTLLPLYMRNSYGYVTSEIRYPAYKDLKLLASVQLPALLGLAGTLLFVWQRLRPLRGQAEQTPAAQPALLPLALPPLLYIFSCFLLFKHAFHFQHDVVFAVLGLPLLFVAFGRTTCHLTLVALLPCLLIPPLHWIKLVIEAPDNKSSPTLVAPNGQTFSGKANEVTFYANIFSIIRHKADASGHLEHPSLLLIDWKPGVYFFTNAKVVGRNLFYYPNCIRPWEQKRFDDELAGADVIGIALPRSETLTAAEVNPEKIAEVMQSYFTPSILSKITARLSDPICAGVDVYSQRQLWLFSVR